VSPLLHDRMTECRYVRPPDTFSSVSGSQRAVVRYIDIIGEGRTALQRANTEIGTSVLCVRLTVMTVIVVIKILI